MLPFPKGCGKGKWLIDDDATWHRRTLLMDALMEEIKQGAPINKLYAIHLVRTIIKSLSPFMQNKYGKKLAALNVSMD